MHRVKTAGLAAVVARSSDLMAAVGPSGRALSASEGSSRAVTRAALEAAERFVAEAPRDKDVAVFQAAIARFRGALASGQG